MANQPKHALRVLNAAIALALCQGALTVQAQEAATDTPKDTPPAKEAKKDQGAASTEQIVVTARRREELIQDVPAAVTSFSSDQIDRAGISDVTGLADRTPNTTLKASRATNSTLTAFIRGVGQQDPVAGYEQGVGVYLDDVYLARPQGALTDIYDLARVEVLRGPQGTLYGRNTIGGAVKYVTRNLSSETELNLKATLGNYNEQDFVVKGNLPVSDTVRVGATLASFKRDGFGTNVVNGKDNYNKDVLAGRATLEWTPSSEWFVRISGDRTVDDSLPKQGYRLTPGPAPTNEPVLSGVYDTRANLYTVLGNDQEVVNDGASALIVWTINPDLSLKSITARRKSHSTAPIDFDSLNEVLFEAPALYHDDQTSQEFQLTYTGAKLQGVAGVYYMKANAYDDFDVLYNALGGLSLNTIDDIDTKTWAAYAEGTYDITNQWNVTLGGRYTSDQRQARIYKRTYLGLGGSPTLGNPSAVGLPANTDEQKSDLNRTDTKFTPKLGIGWKFAPEHNTYFTYSQGSKGGMFDPRMDLGGNPNSASSVVKRQGVKPEEITTYEVGLKSAFEGGRFQTNLAAFYSDYKNVQIPGSIATYDANGNVTGFAGTLTNAGKAKISGLELEGILRFTDAFYMSGMLSFIDAKYKEWIVDNGQTGSAEALVNIASSAEFQNTPKNSASVTATYEWPLAVMSRGGSLALNGTASYKSKVYQSEIVRPTGIASIDATVPQNQMLAQDGFTLYDASLVWTSKDHKIQVALIGRNLANTHYKVAGYAFGAYFNTVTAFYGDPRTVKLAANITF